MEASFTVIGFRNWKSALEKGKGFMKHEKSYEHVQSLLRWKELEARKEKGEEISTLINDSQLKRNRYYVSTIVEIVKFIATNELPFRGNTSGDDSDDSYPSGIFLSLFDFIAKKDEKLAKILSSIPQTAKYNSPDIQNEIIALLATMVREKIVKEYQLADLELFTLKVDGTRDSTGVENISIVIRFVSSGKPIEHLLSISKTVALNAEALTNVILETLQEAELDPKNIISQCYDGAAVMSGNHGGVQRLLQNRIMKEIPYIHCYNHKLHLVVMNAVSECRQVADYYTVCGKLYAFFNKPNVAAVYEGETLKRLMEHRWTGHLMTTRAILNNYDDILEVLQLCANRNSKFSVDTQMEASGLLERVNDVEFKFITEFMHMILSVLEPANTILQGAAMDLATSCDVVTAVGDRIRGLRNEGEFITFFKKFEPHVQPEGKRRRIQTNKNLSEFVVMSTLGQENYQTSCVTYKQIFFAVIDRILQELSSRFSDYNKKLYKSLACFKVGDPVFMNKEDLKPLAALCGVDIDTSTCELETAKQYLLKKCASSASSIHNMVQVVYPLRQAFPSVYRLMAAALAFGASTATCEASFSALSRILTPFRMSMTHSRKANLILLSFERCVLNEINTEEFLRRFNDAKNLRLQLFKGVCLCFYYSFV
jgi:hypothetical protein